MAVDTKRAERRALRFQSFDDIRSELARLEAAHRAGTLRQTGNWSPGQIFGHIAAFMNYPFDGYPPALAGPPAPIRFILKFFKKKYLYDKMPVGVKIPKVPGGTVGFEPREFNDGLRMLRASLDRLEGSAPKARNPIFGPLTHDEWKALNTRHSELHLGFLHPEG